MSFNKNIRNSPFKAGDLCFVMIRCPTHKFSPRWYGPVPILKVINDHVYVIKLLDKEKVVNISKLKRYHVNRYTPSSPSSSPKQPTATSTTDSNSSSPTEIKEQSTDSGIQITLQTSSHESPTMDRAHLATQDQQPINVPSCIQPDDATEPSDHQATSDIVSDPAVENSGSNGRQPETTHVPIQVPAPERPRRERKRTQPFQIQPKNKTYE